MLTARDKIGKVVVIRPGALGDVLAVRGVIRFLKDSFRNAEVCLVAPGGRGAFFRRDGWADRCFDWERSAFSWLFSDDAAAPPAALAALFSGCDLVITYLGGEHREALERNLSRLAPAAGAVFCPPSPPPGRGEAVGVWLVRAAASFAFHARLIESDCRIDLARLASARIDVGPDSDAIFPFGSPYVVVHPGSGSSRKNWPLPNYVELGRILAAEQGIPIVVTSGEADGDLGRRLADSLPGAVHVHHPELTRLARILAGARLYVGNDSGVSHLAGAVAATGGGKVNSVVLFGPSDSSIWAPPGAVVLEAGAVMADLPAPAVYAACAKALAGG